MEINQLKREIKAAALARLESSARTVENFDIVIAQWEHIDENNARRYRDHEVKRNEKTLRLGYSGGMVLPAPISHPAWREAMNGDFLSMIFDNPEEMWQLIEDEEIAKRTKGLTPKQKEALYLSAVEQMTPQQIAYCLGKTDRAIRKLLTNTLKQFRIDKSAQD